jgi:hypothetical protein
MNKRTWIIIRLITSILGLGIIIYSLFFDGSRMTPMSRLSKYVLLLLFSGYLASAIATLRKKNEPI